MAEWFWPAPWYLDAGVLALAVALDLALPEPPARLHPVVWMGKLIALLERLSPPSCRVMPFAYGLFMAVLVPLLAGGVTWGIASGLMALSPLAYLIGGAALLKTTFAVSGLARAARETASLLVREELEEARHSLRSLVSRDSSTLAAPMVAAAAIESVAENTSDGYIGPWLAFALLGLPGAFAYRALNTLDSMIGYHGKYEYLGKASARLDDLVNLVPARLSALLVLLSGAMSRMPIGRGWQVMRRDHGRTESPNAGWTMSAMSGVLGVALEKPGHYHLGEGLRGPEAADVHRAVGMAYRVAALGAASSVAIVLARHWLVA